MEHVDEFFWANRPAHKPPVERASLKIISVEFMQIYVQHLRPSKLVPRWSDQDAHLGFEKLDH